MLIHVRHHTRYGYGHLVEHALQRLRLTPRSSQGQDVLDWSVIGPGIETGVQYEDAFGNATHLVVSQHPVEEIEVVCYCSPFPEYRRSRRGQFDLWFQKFS